MSNPLADANSAFVDEDYASAISLYTKAIESDASNPALFLARAQAQIKLEDFMAAVESCDQAIKLDASNFKAQFRRGCRALLIKIWPCSTCSDGSTGGKCHTPGQLPSRIGTSLPSYHYLSLRRIACWHLEELETALEAFQAAQKLGASNGQVSGWIAKCRAQLAEEAAALPTASPQQQAVLGGIPEAAPDAAGSTTSIQKEAPQPLPEPPKPSKYRHQWLQTQKMVEVSIFAKKLTAERLRVDMGEKRLHVVIRDAEGEQEYEMDVQLFSAVDLAVSKWELLGTKVEVILAKQDPSVLWPTLEASESKPAANWSLPEPPRSSYPTSSKSTIDWNKLEAEIKDEEKKEQLDGDAGVQKLFKDIYGDADEDTRRAMNKSYQESNGTSLSTNWKEIGSRKTEWTPPDNADVKKWEM